MITPYRWKVLSLDLNQPLPHLHREPGYAGYWTVFFAGGVALGHAQIPESDLPLEPAHLAIVAARAIAVPAGDRLLADGFHSAVPGLPVPVCRNPVETLAALVDLRHPVTRLTQSLSLSAPRVPLSITVAICTRERPYSLERCLKSLSASSLVPDQILVIDNAPRTDATRLIVARFPGVRYYCEPRPGLSAARNAALATAETDIVAFTDDDVVIHADWLARLRESFAGPKVMVATGLVLPAELETESQFLFEKHLQFFHQGYRRRHFDSAYFSALQNKGVPVWQIGAGANMAIRRVAYDLGFRFDIGLGPGVFGGCGEDSEFWYRTLAEGWSCIYDPAACVYHYHRRDLSGLQHLLHQYMKGHVAALLLQYGRYRHLGNLRRLFLQLPAEYLLLLLRSVATGFSLDCRLLLRGALGCLSGLHFAIARRHTLFQRP